MPELAIHSGSELRRVEHAMGMAIGVDVRDAEVDPTAVKRVFGWLQWVDATFSTYREDSEIRRLDRAELALGDADPLVREVLDRCEALREETGGAFDARATGALDPSGLVKGWAIQRAARILEDAGARTFCLNGAGDLVLRGAPDGQPGWDVGIQHPLQRDRLAAVLSVADAAVATSGAYERGAHVIDPRTGAAPQGVLSVTIVGPDLATADAYATAAFAMELEGPPWTALLDGYEAMTILADETVRLTPGFARYRA